MATRHRIRVEGCDVHVVGTAQGFVPDADELGQALGEIDPDLVALGVPPEDVEALAHLADGDVELPELDPQNQRLLELLERFGPTRVPSPDLETAHSWAQANGRPLAALDLDDEQHADLYVQHVKLRHVIRSSSINRRLLEAEFEAEGAAELMLAWDAAQNALKPLLAIEVARERHMAQRIRGLAADHATLVAVVPVARLAGVVGSLGGA